MVVPFFFFNDTATTEIYTLSLHDALPICPRVLRAAHGQRAVLPASGVRRVRARPLAACVREGARSEEHTSELQSRLHLVCRLLLEKKKLLSANDLHLQRVTPIPFHRDGSC